MVKFSNRHIHFYVKHNQNFNFFWVKLTSNTDANSFVISNPAMKLEMEELIVRQIIGQIAAYAGKLFLIFNNGSLQPTLLIPRVDISNIFSDDSQSSKTDCYLSRHLLAQS